MKLKKRITVNQLIILNYLYDRKRVTYYNLESALKYNIRINTLQAITKQLEKGELIDIFKSRNNEYQITDKGREIVDYHETMLFRLKNNA